MVHSGGRGGGGGVHMTPTALELSTGAAARKNIEIENEVI